eukprot:gene9828-10875_t
MIEAAISQELINEFIENGVVVVPNVLTTEEVEEARRGFHAMLQQYGVDVNDLENTGHALGQLSSTHGSGGVLDLFYFDWKLKINEHPKVLSILQALWRATYAAYDPSSSSTTDKTFAHPFGPFDTEKAYMYIDRVGYRLPSALSQQLGKNNKSPLQRSLTPHLDCSPLERFQGKKWRPIQSFIPLTDTLNKNEGGFEVCKGLHREFDEWVARRPNSFKDNSPPPIVGQFTPIRPKEDEEIIRRMEAVPCRAGDLLLFDYRLAHANSMHNVTDHPREVVYLGFLPAVEVNRRYAEEQKERYSKGELPVDQWHSNTKLQPCTYTFSSLGKKMMTLDPWET